MSPADADRPTAVTPGRRVLEAVVLGVVAGVGLRLIAYGVDYRARLDLCLLTAVVAGLGWTLARLVAAPADPDVYVSDQDPADDGLLLLTSLESRLSWGANDRDRFHERVRPLLVELATERLAGRRGVDPRTHPDHAREILGEPLWQLMTGPLDRSPSRAELSRLVAAIERI